MQPVKQQGDELFFPFTNKVNSLMSHISFTTAECGSCWSFAAVVPLEFNTCKKTGTPVALR